jgi:hypothetical protein
MPVANISINAVDGSNDDLPINTLVQLANQDVGGESTYLWTILDQPPGTADNLSSTTIANPTFTPKKEGTYLIKLVVNLALGTESTDLVVAAVRHLKSRNRAPAAGETNQASLTRGWAAAENLWHDQQDARFNTEFGCVVGQNASGGSLNRGDVVRCNGVATIKSGLPGAEVVATFTKALATVAGNVDELLGVVEGSPSGASSASNGALVKVRHFGLYSTTAAGAPASGDPVYVSDTGALALAPGTVTRKVGAAVAPSGGLYRVYFFGLRAD